MPRSKKPTSDLKRLWMIGVLEAFRAAGDSTKLAKRLGIRKQATSKWKKIPAERVVEVWRVTGVPHQKLRPDLYEGFRCEHCPNPIG